MASTPKPSQKRKNGKKTMKLKEWYPEWGQDQSPINRFPPEVITMILSKIDPFDIIYNAQLVCRSWYEICQDPFLWKHVDKIKIYRSSELECDSKVGLLCRHSYGSYDHDIDYEKIVKKLMDRCCGQLIELDITGDCCDLFLHRGYPLLKRLRLSYSYCSGLVQYSCVPYVGQISISQRVRRFGTFTQSAWRFPMLEEIDLSHCVFTSEDVKIIGRSCPLLKSFKFTMHTPLCYSDSEDDGELYPHYPVLAFAIAATMTGLHRLVLSGSTITNAGLQAILDGCSHLVSLDIRRCPYINLLDGDLGKRCREQIQDFRGPEDDDDTDDPEEADFCSCVYDIDNDISVTDDDEDDDDYDLYDEYDEIIYNSKTRKSSSLLLL